MTAVIELTFQVWRNHQGAWKHVASRVGYEAARAAANAMAAETGDAHKVTDDAGLDLLPIDFESISDDELRTLWVGTLVARGDYDEHWAGIAADSFVDERRRELVNDRCNAIYKEAAQ